MKFISSFILLSLLAAAANTRAASCCGSSQAFPSLILGDEKAQTLLSYSRSTITDEALASGKWLSRLDENQTETFKLEAATLLTERWQLGLSLPLAQKKSIEGTSSWNRADTSLVLADETWPERFYSWWRPKGVSYLQMMVPSGDSLYDDPKQTFLSTRGRGFWSLGAGVAFVKRYPQWDFFANTEVHKSWARSGVSSTGEDYQAEPGWGTSQNIGAGWSYKTWRLGAMVGLVYEDPIRISGSLSSDGTLQRFVTVGSSLSYMWNDLEGVSLSWSDQTLFGAPVNSSLSESWAFSYSHRWMR